MAALIISSSTTTAGRRNNINSVWQARSRCSALCVWVCVPPHKPQGGGHLFFYSNFVFLFLFFFFISSVIVCSQKVPPPPPPPLRITKTNQCCVCEMTEQCWSSFAQDSLWINRAASWERKSLVRNRSGRRPGQQSAQLPNGLSAVCLPISSQCFHSSFHLIKTDWPAQRFWEKPPRRAQGGLIWSGGRGTAEEGEEEVEHEEEEKWFPAYRSSGHGLLWPECVRQVGRRRVQTAQRGQ